MTGKKKQSSSHMFVTTADDASKLDIHVEIKSFQTIFIVLGCLLQPVFFV